MIFVTKKLDCSDDLNKAIEMCEFLGGEIYEKHPSSITFLVEDEALKSGVLSLIIQKIVVNMNRSDFVVLRNLM